MQKFIENLEESERINKSLDHLLTITFPIVKDKRILIKILSELKVSIKKTINSILQYEFIYKRIKLHENPNKNFEIFVKECSKRYKITPQEIEKIKEIFDIAKKHEESSMEFMRGEKIVILSKEMNPRSISLEQTKDYLETVKNLTKKARNGMLLIK